MQQTDEYPVIGLPSLQELRQMMEPNSAPADQFFIYYVWAPCGRELPRVACLEQLTVVDDSIVTLGCVTELFNVEENPRIVQSYMDGTIFAWFDDSGKMAFANIELDRPTKVNEHHPIFVYRPESVTVGA